MKILTNYDFNKNQIIDVVIDKRIAAPTPAESTAGQVYYDTVKKRLFYYNGTKWEGSDALDAVLTGTEIVTAINSSSSTINDARLSSAVRTAIAQSHNSHSIADVSGLKPALDSKVDNNQVLTNVPTGAKFTDTVTSINNKTGTITKADIVALGIPAQDTVYTHPSGTNPHQITKSTVGLSNVDNTSDLAKPISNLTMTALNGKVNNERVLTDVPENAIFTDTKYTHPSTAGWKHIPTGGTTGQILINSASGTAEWDNQTITTINGKTGTINKADIVALGIPSSDTNTTYSVFSASRDGLVPKPTLAQAGLFLTGAGTWVKPQDTLYTLPVAGTNLGGIKTGGSISISTAGVVTVVNNSHTHTTANITGLDAALSSKETPAGALNKAATAEGNANLYTDDAISELVGSAPEVLDTLHEIAAALGDDPNFAATITENISKKTDKFSATMGSGTDKTFVVKHGFNSRNVVVLIRQTAAPYSQVITDVEMTTENTATVKFAVAPKANEYTITIIG